MHFFGIDWVGVDAENGKKLLLSIAFVAVVLLASRAVHFLVGVALRRGDAASVQNRFWTRQGVSLFAAVVLILGILSIWFNDPARLATAFGLVSAGLAFALQQVVTSVAGYFVILRGNTFTVGDRIAMGGVRGDVMRLGFIPDHHHGDGPTGGRVRRRLDVGAQPAVHRAHRHRVEQQDLRRAGFQLHTRLPLHLGGDNRSDHLHRRPRQGRGDHAGGDPQARRRPPTAWRPRRRRS